VKRACIATVDATHARLYTYEDSDPDPAQRLREVSDLVNPGRRLRPSEMFSETRPSLGQAPGRGGSREPGSTKDDHRDDHIEMMDAKFAKEVVGEIDRIVRAHDHTNVIVIATPKMLGELRKANGVLHRPGVTLEEIPRELTKLTSAQLHDHLAQLDLIPARERLTVAR
jgi:protein required for attachment to host cells